MIGRRQATAAALAALLPASSRAQSPAEFARQVDDDKAFFTALLKQLDIKLE
jgi:hypothetical protein